MKNSCDGGDSVTQIPSAGSYTRTVSTPSQPLIGSTIDGRYRVDALVARGGMATVFRATDLRLERTVALKVMHGSLAEDHEFVARFVREARSAAQLSHSSIVAVYDQGEADGFVYLAMEYVQGQTLRDLLRDRQRLTPHQALAVLEPVLDALQAAHTAGFAHRDIKPENVLLASDGRVKVADFGLARAIVTTNATGLTQGLLIGTVAYLAPEQVERGHADARTDVYSAGILLYESVVGQTPFSGATPMSVAYQHVHSHVPVPSAIRPELPPEIDELVRIATQQSPESRYRDAADFVDHLRSARQTMSSHQPLANTDSEDDSSNRTVILDREASTVTVGLWTTNPLPGAGLGANAADATSGPTAATPPTYPTLISPIAAAAPAAEAMVGPPGGPWITPPAPASTNTNTPSGPPADPPDEPPRSRRPRRFRILIAAVVLALLGTAVGFGAWAYTNSQIVTVPTLVGMTPSAANAALAGDELVLDVTGEDFSASVPEGSILSTNPTAGAQIRRGDTIAATTSAGPQLVDVPKVIGKNQTKAESNLRALGFVSTATEAFSDSMAAGRVISVSPNQGKTVPVGTEVALVISKGPPPVTVPNVVGSSRDDAAAELRALGLTPVVQNQLPVVVISRVYSQDPAPGTVVSRGTTITITIV
jgi:serine/threonine protein kinase/beta-lactam-binding protein with PASTA domain